MPGAAYAPLTMRFPITIVHWEDEHVAPIQYKRSLAKTNIFVLFPETIEHKICLLLSKSCPMSENLEDIA